MGINRSEDKKITVWVYCLPLSYGNGGLNKAEHYKNVRWGLFMHHKSQPSQRIRLSLGELICLHVPRENGHHTWILGNLRKGGLSHQAVSLMGTPISLSNYESM